MIKKTGLVNLKGNVRKEMLAVVTGFSDQKHYYGGGGGAPPFFFFFRRSFLILKFFLKFFKRKSQKVF